MHKRRKPASLFGKIANVRVGFRTDEIVDCDGVRRLRSYAADCGERRGEYGE
jgi:hypothetical protein